MSEPIGTRRVDVPSDPRDLPGEFRYRREVEVRFADTDAMGHVNNAVFLTYCEMARAGHYEAVTGRRMPAATHAQAESLILAEMSVSYRSPAFFGETLVVEARATHIGRTSVRQEFRITANESRYGRRRLVAVAGSTLVVYDYAQSRPIPVPDDFAASLEEFEGRCLHDAGTHPPH